MAEDAPGDGKQQFTVEKSTLVDSFCGVEVTVLSAGTEHLWGYLDCYFSSPIDRRILCR